MDSRASLSSNIVIANQARDDPTGKKDPVEKRVNFSKTVNVADEDENCPTVARCLSNERKGKKSEDTPENREKNPSKPVRSRSSKPGQMIDVRFPSSSRVVYGIQYGDPFHQRRRRGRDWFRHSARCVSRISNRTSGDLVRRGRWESSRKRGRRDDEGYTALRRRQQSKQLSREEHGPEREQPIGAAESSWKRNDVSAGQISRKRRVGIVENQYVAGSEGGSSVCELVHSLERLFGEREAGDEAGHAMRSKKQQTTAEETTAIDPIEANETYDEFDTVRMPIVRSLSKSPQSDEGIEADPERRRGSVARCWSLDSAAASDEDLASLTTTHQLKRHKLQVTRCCSSDSAVLSDEDQIKGWDSTNVVEGSETEHNEGRPRYWRTPSVVVSDYSDYSYLDERLERNDLELEKYEGTSGTPSQASSCSCLDCDEIRESLDNQFLRVCRSRRHSDSCCLCLDSMNATATRNYNEAGNRRNSCLDSTTSYYSKLDSQLLQYTQENSQELQEKAKIEFLNIPPSRKISDCSTSSLSGDESDVTDQHHPKPRVYKYFNVTPKEKAMFSATPPTRSR
ncbi:inositol 1,4,5-triphosphate kinase 2 isoform X2 [Nomia melanderi]|uniref:inositol 1,4,5-triphosphate kinase 2 isoform X2 n=1 Tax=Nomia melanderi TaxID=2448451 RepID=UPI003FCE2994